MSRFSSTASFFRKFLHVIFPATCACCNSPLWDDPVPFVCQPCWETVASISGPCCPHCGVPYTSSVALSHSPDHECGACRTKSPAFTQTWSLFPYKPPLKEAIVLFKYRGKRSLTKPFIQKMISALPALPPIDLLMPVPLHPQRLREREYNQSHLLAHGSANISRSHCSYHVFFVFDRPCHKHPSRKKSGSLISAGRSLSTTPLTLRTSVFC